jgi:hypothetical protein
MLSGSGGGGSKAFQRGVRKGNAGDAEEFLCELGGFSLRSFPEFLRQKALPFWDAGKAVNRVVYRGDSGVEKGLFL